MTIEKLTEDERVDLATQWPPPADAYDKVLRIVEQLTAELQRRDEGEPLRVAVVERLRCKEEELAILQAAVEGENGLRASRDAGWALANAQAKELKSERRQRHELRELLSEEKAVSKHWKQQYLELHQKTSALQLENDDMRNEPYTRAKTAEARIEKAIHWLVTCRYDVPANILADRARLALEALRGK